VIDLFKSMSVSGSALSAERLRMTVTAANLANANTPGYRRKEVVLTESFQDALGRASGGASGVQASAIIEDTAPNRQVYDPSNPQADARGYVSMPNVDSVTEMVDLISAQRSYEANVTAMQTAKQLYSRTLDLLR
jgi:flagellar basal-body rod protein FlgC